MYVRIVHVNVERVSPDSMQQSSYWQIAHIKSESITVKKKKMLLTTLQLETKREREREKTVSRLLFHDFHVSIQ